MVARKHSLSPRKHGAVAQSQRIASRDDCLKDSEARLSARNDVKRSKLASHLLRDARGSRERAFHLAQRGPASRIDESNS